MLIDEVNSDPQYDDGVPVRLNRWISHHMNFGRFLNSVHGRAQVTTRLPPPSLGVYRQDLALNRWRRRRLWRTAAFVTAAVCAWCVWVAIVLGLAWVVVAIVD